MDRFEQLYERFGCWDCAEWCEPVDAFMRVRIFSDDAWLDGIRVDPIDYFGA